VYSNSTVLQDWYSCKGVQEHYRGSADVQVYKGCRGVKEYSCSTRGKWVQE